MGGSTKAWQKFNTTVLATKTPEELATLRWIAENTDRQSWYRRVLINRLAFQIHQVFAALENTNAGKMDLPNKSYWYELTLAERRGLLLASYNKWWWEVSSSHVGGAGKWMNLSFLVAEMLMEPLESPLQYRTHQLVANKANAGFLSTLFRHFSTEIEVFKSIKDNEQGRAQLSDLLYERITFFYHLKNSLRGILTSQQVGRIDQQILRAELLSMMLEKNRVISRDEGIEVTDFIVMPDQVFHSYKNQQLVHSTTRAITSIAFYIAISYLLGAVLDEKKEPIEVPLNDLLMGLPTHY